MSNIVLVLISTTLCPIFVYLIVSYIRNKATISSLESKIVDLEKQNNRLQSENTEYKSKIDKYENKESILSEYEWDDSLGTYKSKSEPFYYICNICINKTPPVLIKLKKEKYLYRCTNCNEPYQTQQQLDSMYKEPKNLY